MTGPIWEPVLPPGLAEFLAWNPQPVPVLPTLAVVLAVLYLSGAIRLWTNQRRWSTIRTICFLLGCVLLFALTGLGLEGYGLRMFSVFIFQQLTLMMVIPPLLVIGSPGTLLLRATPHSRSGRIVLRAGLAALRSRTARFILHPALVTPLLVLSLFGVYVGGLADLLLPSWIGHTLLEFFFLTVGVLLATPLISVDPLPRRTSFVARIFDTFIEMQLHAAFGLVMLFATTALIPFYASPPPQWGINPVRDQSLAGTLVWTYGELPVVAILIVTLVRWQRQERRRTDKETRRADEAGDPDLEQYNAYLRSLDKSSNGQNSD
ncbi:cytochrome c oxidase assembly protein [Paramicrobacterium agarici]|uniref:cytochrome c oxidase assembly protein n=1 Tax=Paramicrobacterium agarici TaxID=630514 RepID=UPI001153BC03|nr:cytochrome c oxidase assembly protein [Microbacterium agarici]TQO22250.1 putative membrane protein [Microbacterium agarici]